MAQGKGEQVFVNILFSMPQRPYFWRGKQCVRVGGGLGQGGN